MYIDIVVPALGESVTEATIARWHKKSGDFLKADEMLLEIETDKVTLEVSAPANGVLNQIAVAEGETVKVGQVLAKFEAKEALGGSISEAEPVQSKIATHGPQEVVASPAAKKIATENSVDLALLPGSGKDGRVTKKDVVQSSTGSIAQVNVERQSVLQEERETRVKMTRLRKTIASRLKESQNTAAILTTFNEVDMSAVIALRQSHQEKFLKKHGIKLGFMSFFVKAVVQALKEIPAVNAEIDGDDIVYKKYYDMGIAVGTDNGLVVPVLRDADALSFAAIEKGIAALGLKAKEGKLTVSDMTGASFSITNGGIYGSMLSTPIINPPQSGILGMHNIVERPYVIGGQILVRPIMYLALSYDHRIIDGREAVTFLVRVKEMIESPEKVLLEV